MKRISTAFLGTLALSLNLYGCGGSSVGSNASSFPVTETPGFGTPIPSDGTFVDSTTSAVGFYTDGSLPRSTTLPDSGRGFFKIFLLRDRNFATATLVRSIEMATARWRSEFPIGDRVQVGDIAQSGGGYLSGHASHQNGLDADIAYLKMNHVERDPNTNGPHGFAESFVQNGALTSNFDVARNWAILRNFVGQGNVSRIFVDPVIKATFCKTAAIVDPSLSVVNRDEVLRRLRPLAAHDDHFHIRIQCPPNHLKCLAQAEPAAGTGCADVGVGVATAEGFINLPAETLDDELGQDDD
jgi:penicillin-insensitive murein endopeptidase